MTIPAYEADHPFNCPACQHHFVLRIGHVVLPASAAWHDLAQGQFNCVTCPACGDGGILGADFLLLHPDQQRATCFIPDIETLNQEQGQHAVDRLIALLEQACVTAGLVAPGLQHVEVTASYAAMVNLVRSLAGAKDGQAGDAGMQQAFTVLQMLLRAKPAERAALINRLGEGAASLAPLADDVARHAAQEQGEDAPVVGALHQLHRELLGQPGLAPVAAGVSASEPPDRRLDTLPSAPSGLHAPPFYAGDSDEPSSGGLRFRSGAEPAGAAPVIEEHEIERAEPEPRSLLTVKVRPPDNESTDWTIALHNGQTDETVAAPFILPAPSTVTRLRALMGKARLANYQEEEELRALGRELYASLLPGAVGNHFAALWDDGTPIHLHLDVPADLQWVPWEFIANDEEYLARDPLLSTSRAAPVARRRQRRQSPEPLTLPLRLLMVVSSPLDLDERFRLDADRELMLIRSSLKGLPESGRLEIELEDEPSLERLHAVLDRFDPHIVHLTGHGYLLPNPDAPEQSLLSGLLLEDEQGMQRAVPARDVAALFKGRPALRAVVVSACVSALPGSAAAIDSTAHELVRAGVPAVIAMQDRIRDDSAMHFAHAFYVRLLEGASLPEALALGRERMALAGAGSSASDWAIPVLLTAQPATDLFNFTRQGRSRPRAHLNSATLGLTDINDDNYFVGRQREQRAIRAALTRPERGQKVIIISGLGGFGKSTLAFRSVQRALTDYGFAHTITCKRDAWPGLELAVRLFADGLTAAGFPALLGTLSADPRRQFSPAELGELVALALNAAPGILILDNFEDLLDPTREIIAPAEPKVAAWLEALLLRLDHGRVLITSRYHFAFTRNERHGASIARISLDILQPSEALRLMNASSNPHLGALSASDQLRLYRAGLDNPQMIEWAEAQRGLAGGARRQEELLRLHQKFSEQMVLGELYQSLPESARTLLRRSAIYAEAQPPEFLSVQCPGASAYLDPLLDRKLLTVFGPRDGDDSAPPRFRQHESVRHFALGRLEAEEGDAGLRAAHLRAAEQYEWYANEISHDFQDYVSTKTHYLASARLDKAARLLRQMEQVLNRQGMWQEALDLVRELRAYGDAYPDQYATLSVIQKVHIMKHEADLMINLGHVRASISQYDQALQLLRLHPPPLFQAESAILVNLGTAYIQLGEVRTGIDYYEQALTISRQIDDRQGEGQDLGNLGIAYSQLGEVRTAIDYYTQALAISRQIGDRQSEGQDLGNLGNTYFQLGEVRTAIDYHTQALVISRQIGDRRSEGQDRGNLGIAYAALGEVRTAVQHTLVAALIKHVTEDPSIATAMQFLAAQCQTLGRAPFEHLVREVCAAQGLDHDHCLHLLGAYHVFAGLPLSQQHKHLVLVFAHAAQGVAAAQQALQQWLERARTAPNWQQFVPVVERLLAGERDPVVLLAPENQLGGIGRAIIDAVLRGLHEPEELAALEIELWAATEQTPTLNEALREAAVVLGVALAGNPQAQEAIREQLLPQMDRSADFQNLAAVVRRMLAGERDPAVLLNPANGLDAADRQVVELALGELTRVQGLEDADGQ